MDQDDEPELWVLGGDDDDRGIGVPAPSPDESRPNLASTLTSDDVAGDDWADTAWLDELAPRPSAEPDPATRPAPRPHTSVEPETAAPRRPTFVNPPDDLGPTAGGRPGDDGAATSPASASTARRSGSVADEFAGLIDPITSTETAPSNGATVDPDGDDTTAATADASAPRHRRPRPTGGDQTAEFLRELSRLALDED